MALIRITDFNNLIPHLQPYYDQHKVEGGIAKLMQFYNEEAFDTADITNDWVPDDFKNCDGIDIFVDSLNIESVDIIHLKQILFKWFCHWLLPNIPRPLPLITTQHDQDPIQKVAERFAMQLMIHITQFHDSAAMANNIKETFIKICNDDNFNNIDDLSCDLEDDHDESIIIGSIITEYNEYREIRQKIFYILQNTVEMIKYDYPPFDIKTFKWNHSKTTWDKTNRICTEEINSFFHNPVEEQDLSKIKKEEDKQDLELMKAKALDFENKFPILSNLMDAFSRYCADENEKLWKHKDVSVNTDMKQYIQHHSIQLQPSTWFKQYIGLYNYIKEVNNDTAECIASGLKSFMKRILHKFSLNHVMDSTIFDDYNIFAKYVCAFNKFVYDINDKKQMKYDENDDRKTQSKMNHFEHLPLQIDLWIIPRLTKKNVHNCYLVPDDLNDYKFEEEESGDSDNDVEASDVGEIQELGKCIGTKGDAGKIRNIETHLTDAGYEEGKDYWCYTPQSDDNYNVIQLEKNIKELWRRNEEWQNGEWDKIRYTRFIMIIDRRNPEHIDKGKMKDDRKTWRDRMYLIRPKPKKLNENQKKLKKSNNYDKICKLYYEFELNETFIGNTMDFLLPMIALETDDYYNDFSGLDAGNGYKFVVSFHLYFSNKVKMYWLYGQGTARFQMNDIKWLWPRYFNPIKDENDENIFQCLDDDSKIALREAINKYPLKDLQFKEFLDQIKTFDVYLGHDQ